MLIGVLWEHLVVCCKLLLPGRGVIFHNRFIVKIYNTLESIEVVVIDKIDKETICFGHIYTGKYCKKPLVSNPSSSWIADWCANHLILMEGKSKEQASRCYSDCPHQLSSQCPCGKDPTRL